MEEISTFSAAVDRVIARSSRMDRRVDILSYVRLTLREIQTLALFQKDMEEDVVTAQSDPFIWQWPQTFRKMWTVQYPARIDQRGRPVYPRALQGPGKAIEEWQWYYYPSGDSFIFAGHGEGAPINIAYLTYFAPLKYFAVTDRPAIYSVDTLEWSYAAPYDMSTELRAMARAMVTNWALFNWFEVVIEGALAKLYKTVDDPRAVATFALYKQLQSSLLQGEANLAIDTP